MKPRASYTAEVIEDVLVIKDLDNGSISVTNDIDIILAYEQEQTGHNWENKRIIYRDSLGDWDQILWNGSRVRFERLTFDPVARKNFGKALEAVKSLPSVFPTSM